MKPASDLAQARGPFSLRNAQSLPFLLTLPSSSVHPTQTCCSQRRKGQLTSLKMCSFDFVFYFLLSFQQGTSQILTGLIFHPLFPGAILPTSQANPDAQNGILPAGQAGANPAAQGTPEDPFSTPSGTDDDFASTTPAGIQRGRPTTEETPTGSPKGRFSKPGGHPRAMNIICGVREKGSLSCLDKYRS